MQLTSAQRGSFEQVVGTFYMSSNEWVVDENASPANWGLNLKGFLIYLDLKLANYSSVPGVSPGMACCVPSTSGNTASYCAPLGVLLDDMIIGSRKLTGEWVRVLQYGHCDRIIAYNAAAVDTNDHLLYNYGAVSGKVGGMTYSELANGYRTLSGAVQLTLDGAASTAVINMDGTTTVVGGNTSTWLTPPRVASVPVNAPAPEQRFVGFHYKGDVPVQLPEYLNGNTTNVNYGNMRVVKGFVNCLGGVGSW